MFTETMMPPGLKPPTRQTDEDIEIIRAHRAGLMVLFDRLDAHDMLLYAVLRGKGLKKVNLAVGASELHHNLEEDFVRNVMEAVEEAAGPRPTIQ